MMLQLSFFRRPRTVSSEKQVTRISSCGAEQLPLNTIVFQIAAFSYPDLLSWPMWRLGR